RPTAALLPSPGGSRAPVEHARPLAQYGGGQVALAGAAGQTVAHLQRQQMLFARMAEAGMGRLLPLHQASGALVFVEGGAGAGVFQPVLESPVGGVNLGGGGGEERPHVVE